MPTADDPRRAGVRRQALAIAIAVGAFGLSFGAVSVSAGFTVAQTCALSLLVFTGASQFALVGVVQGGGGLVVASTTALALGGRNALYGIRLGRLLGRLPLSRRLVAAQAVVDETTALATAQPDDDLGRYAFAVMAAMEYALWNLATLAGALAGRAVGNPARLGLDVAFPAAFLALLRPRLEGAPARRVAVGAAAIAVACTPLLPAGLPILLAVVAVLPVTLTSAPPGGPEPDADAGRTRP